MDQVGRYCMSPAHVAPLVTKGVELEEQMVSAIEEDWPIGIVDPVGRRGEVELRFPAGLGYSSWRSGCGLLRACSHGGNQRQRQEKSYRKMKWEESITTNADFDGHEWVALNHEITEG